MKARRSKSLARALAIVAIAGGLNAACTSSDNETLDSSNVGSSGAAPTAAPDTANAQPGTGVAIASTAPGQQPVTSVSADAPETLPLTDDAAFLSMLYALMGVATEQETVVFLTVGNAPESDVARCMSEAGFQYQEGPSPEEQLGADLRTGMPADQYAATYGFGVAATELGLTPALPADPNMEYVSSLSQGQRDAYYQTYRTCSGPDPDDPFRNSNAWNVALEQFRGVVDTDERAVAAETRWRDCMASAGFDYDTPNAMRAAFYARLSGADRAQLERLHDDEVAAAVANVPCEEDLVSSRREVVTARIGEFRGLFDAAIASGAAPDAQG